MKLSEKALTWIMRCYPPLFFQRIWVKKIYPDFLGAEIKISLSVLNKNSNGSIFGGTIFSATDPFFPLLFGQIMRKKGIRSVVWLKSGEIRYLKPARSNLYFTINIPKDEIQHAETQLKELSGKYVQTFSIEILDKVGEVCAIAENEVYVKNLDF